MTVPKLPHDLPQAEVSLAREPAAGLSRRQFLTLGALSTAAVLAGADATAQAEFWPTDGSTFGVINGKYAEMYQDNAWVVFPGFGNRHGLSMAQDVSHALGVERPVGYFVYPNDKLSITGMQQQLRPFGEKYDTLSAYFHSMGGIVGLETLKAIERPLDRIWLNSSPLNLNDTKVSTPGKLLARLGAAVNFEGDFATTYIGTLRGNLDHCRPGNILKQAFQSFSQTAQGPSPRLLASMLNILAENQIEQNWRDYTGLLRRTTEVVYCLPQDVRRDTVVDNYQAAARWDKFFDRFGIAMKYLVVPDAGHADTARASYAAGPWLQSRA